MQEPNMQKMIDGLTRVGDKAIDSGDVNTGVLAGALSGLMVSLCQLNATLEEIRDAIKETT